MKKVELHTEDKSEQVSPACGNTMLGAVRFHSSEAGKVASEFKKHFGVSFHQYFQGFIFLKPEILLDIQKFDDYLINRYNYEGSMSDFIKAEFGENAHNFILRLI